MIRFALALVLVVLFASQASAQELDVPSLSFLGPHLGRISRLEVNGARYEVRTSRTTGSLGEFAAAFRAACADPIELGDDRSRYLSCARTRDGRDGFRLVWAHATAAGVMLVEVAPMDGPLMDVSGEVPGGELPGMPRPPRAVRVLRVRADRGVSAVSYEVPASEDILETTLRRIEDAGWTPIAAAGDRGVVRFRRGARIVDAVVTGEGERVRITFLETPVEGAAR